MASRRNSDGKWAIQRIVDMLSATSSRSDSPEPVVDADAFLDYVDESATRANVGRIHGGHVQTTECFLSVGGAEQMLKRVQSIRFGSLMDPRENNDGDK
jgi:hypothetical protein